MTIEYSDHDTPEIRELLNLYNSVHWTVYTSDPERLGAAIDASLRVVTARASGELVGLARAVGDGFTVLYLQDILVAPAYQRSGIGRQLFTRVLQPYADVRQKVLLTDDEPGQRAFYESMGFTEVRDMERPIRVFAEFL